MKEIKCGAVPLATSSREYQDTLDFLQKKANLAHSKGNDNDRRMYNDRICEILRGNLPS